MLDLPLTLEAKSGCLVEASNTVFILHCGFIRHCNISLSERLARSLVDSL